MPTLLEADEITERLADLPNWDLSGPALTRAFVCADFPAAVAFVVRCGFVAEQLGHHPDLDIRWRVVHVACTTHDAGGITALDFELAHALHALEDAS